MTDEYEKLLDELALVYTRAAVDAFLRGEQTRSTNEKPALQAKQALISQRDTTKHEDSNPLLRPYQA